MSEPIQDIMDPARAKALCATLGIPYRTPLPPYFHTIYFWRAYEEQDLGPDGHPKLGLEIPELGYPRRMWAGGRITWHVPLQDGIRAEAHSAIVKKIEKTGHSGRFALVTQRLDVRQKGQAVLSEERDLIYRPAAHPDDPAPAPLDVPSGKHLVDLKFSMPQLFRYSALTFNGHRIHYDQAFTKAEFGYDTVVVHGPLLAQYLMLTAEYVLGGLSRFAYKAHAPVLQSDRVQIAHNGAQFWISSDRAGLHMSASAEA
ncbi:MAG: acyl dehydratase [Pseudomonadota bacterium]